MKQHNVKPVCSHTLISDIVLLPFRTILVMNVMDYQMIVIVSFECLPDYHVPTALSETSNWMNDPTALRDWMKLFPL